MQIFAPSQPLNSAFTNAIGSVLQESLAAKRAGGPVDSLISIAEQFASGGKRIRPAFCVWGYLAVAEPPSDPSALLRLAASLELLHLSALIHDDIMDDAATRRGLPSAHVQLARECQTISGLVNAGAFGRSGALVLGNLLATWSADLADEANPTSSTRSFLSEVRTDVNIEQYLDALAQAQDPREAQLNPDSAKARAEDVVEWKTARYTVIRPLQAGAAMAGATDELLAGLADFGSALGRAFQYRDDLLGVFGDPQVTGKPAGDDLREGKLTVLIVHAIAKATKTDTDKLISLLDRAYLTETEVDLAREIIHRSGAEQAVEADIAAAKDAALRQLATLPIRQDARLALTNLVTLAIDRDA